MNIVQKRFSNQATFTFEERELRYTIRDKGGSQSFGIEYGAIPDDIGEMEERNVWYRNVGIFWVGLGLLQIGMRLAEDGTFRGSIWLTLGIACFIAYWVGLTRYSTINTEKGRIFIIKDKNHDRVLNELKERRKGQWRSWYGEVNLENEPAKEIGKFRWLKEHGAITDAEYNEAIEQISQHHGLQPGGPPGEPVVRRLN